MTKSSSVLGEYAPLWSLSTEAVSNFAGNRGVIAMVILGKICMFVTKTMFSGTKLRRKCACRTAESS